MRPPTVIDFVTSTWFWPKNGENWPNKKPWRLPLAASVGFFLAPQRSKVYDLSKSGFIFSTPRLLSSQMRPPTVIDFVTSTRFWPKIGEIWPNKKPWRLPLAASVVFFLAPQRSKVYDLSKSRFIFSNPRWVSSEMRLPTVIDFVTCTRSWPKIRENWPNKKPWRLPLAASMVFFLAPQRSKVYDLSKSRFIFSYPRLLSSQMRPPTVIDFVTGTRFWPKSGEIWPNKKPWRLPLLASVLF